MKPQAASEIRGPFRPIATNVPGIEICEHFPRLASMANRLVFVRGLHHDGPPLHETGQRYAMTGKRRTSGLRSRGRMPTRL